MISLGMILVVGVSLFGSSCVDAVTLSKRLLGGVCTTRLKRLLRQENFKSTSPAKNDTSMIIPTQK